MVTPRKIERDASTLDLLREEDRFVLELVDDRRTIDDIAALASIPLSALAPILDRLVTAGAIALDGLDDAPTRRLAPTLPEEIPISFDIAWDDDSPAPRASQTPTLPIDIAWTDDSPAPRASQAPTLPSIFDSWDTPSQRTTVPGSPKFDETSEP